MSKHAPSIPNSIDPNTSLRLEIAARKAFPHGSTVGRRAAAGAAPGVIKSSRSDAAQYTRPTSATSRTRQALLAVHGTSAMRSPSG